MDFTGIGFTEVLIILVVALLVFGPHRLPEVARALGQGIRKLKMATNELTRDITEEMNREVKDVKDEVRKASDEVSSEVKSISDSVARDVNQDPENLPESTEKMKKDDVDTPGYREDEKEI